MQRFWNRNTPLCLSDCSANQFGQLPTGFLSASIGCVHPPHRYYGSICIHSPCSLIRLSSVFVFLVRLQKCKAKTDKQNAKQKWRKETAISFVWLRFLTMPPPYPSPPHFVTPIRLLTLSLSSDHFLFRLYLFLFSFFFLEFSSAAVAIAVTAVSQLCFLFAVWCVSLSAFPLSFFFFCFAYSFCYFVFA